MKDKHIIAIIAAIVCVAVVATGLFFLLIGPGEDPESSKPKGETSEQSQKEEAPPAKEDPKEQAEEAPVEEPEEEPEQEPEKQPEKENQSNSNDYVAPDNSDLAGYSGNAKVSTLTKEEVEKILNDPYMVLVNRDHVLPSSYKGINLVSYNSDHQLTNVCATALRRLITAGKEAGYNYVLYSGYRTYSRQYNNYYNKINSYKNSGYSEEEAIRLTNQYYAPPGASEHHTGLAADVCIPSIVNTYACLHENYEYTDEYKWFAAHAHEYGFILRYRKGDEAITGYNFEPWHYRYVGVDIATEIYKRDITLEEYVEELEARLAQLSA